jgi:hypothetical protein
MIDPDLHFGYRVMSATARGESTFAKSFRVAIPAARPFP